MTIGFVVDSGTPLPDKFSQDLAEYDIPVEKVPFTITFEKPVFDKMDFKDSVDVTAAEFYQMMNEYENKTDGLRPTTTQPSPNEFREAYLRLFDNGAKHVIAMPLVREHSGTYQSAILGGEELDVTVIDTQTGSSGVFFEMIEGFEAIKQGKSLDEVVSAINNSRDRVHINLFVDNPSYVAERLHPVARKFVDAMRLKVKVEFYVDEGKITPTRGLARKRSGIVDKVINTMHNQFGDKEIVAYTLFTSEPGIADMLAERMNEFNLISHEYVPELEKVALCPAIGRYIGPKAGGVISYVP